MSSYAEPVGTGRKQKTGNIMEENLHMLCVAAEQNQNDVERS